MPDQLSQRHFALPPELQGAVDRFTLFTREIIKSEQQATIIQAPLYHYTDLRALRGIFEHGKIWFTDYRHLNDPSEIIYGLDHLHKVIEEIISRETLDGRGLFFLRMLFDLFRGDNLSLVDFFLACFSRARDDLGQWRAYADNGRGVAIGFAPCLFAVIEPPPPSKRHEFLGPVRYSEIEISTRHRIPIERAVDVFIETADLHSDLFINDREVGVQFARELSLSVIAQPLIWNCVTSKHSAYKNEEEVRLVILGGDLGKSEEISTRFRGSEIVPYIAQPFDARVKGNITEIVIGPAAHPDTERTIGTMLRSLGIDFDIKTSRSTIPYRSTSV
jgi:hypothetical protein